MQSIIAGQDNIDRQIRSTNTQTDPSIFKRLSQEEKLIKRELNDIQNSLNTAARDVKDFSRRTAQGLENLSDSDIAKSSLKLIDEVIKNLDKNEPYEAMENSYAGLTAMETFGSNLN